jgi:hypothetical protein
MYRRFKVSMPQQLQNTKMLIQGYRDVSRRLHEKWKLLPTHLIYTPVCWDSDLEPMICLGLTMINLSYLQIDFQICRMLEKSESESRAVLLGTSVEILETLLQLGRFRDKARYLIQDLSDLICDTSTRYDIHAGYLTNIDHSIRSTERLCSDRGAIR